MTADQQHGNSYGAAAPALSEGETLAQNESIRIHADPLDLQTGSSEKASGAITDTVG